MHRCTSPHKYGQNPDELLALAHLRQWARDRGHMRHGRTSHPGYIRPGWSTRTNRNADAAIVRAIDFERCLAQLEPLEQVTLVWLYRDGFTREHAALAAGCSVRTIHGLAASGRRRLARALDEKGLL
jgi:DNA-directed RNA polymerase specialized sigma24 family protein